MSAAQGSAGISCPIVPPTAWERHAQLHAGQGPAGANLPPRRYQAGDRRHHLAPRQYQHSLTADGDFTTALELENQLPD